MTIMDFPRIADRRFVLNFWKNAMQHMGDREIFSDEAVFTLTDIYDFIPRVRDQQRSGVCRAFGSGTPVYSTGKLEQAIERGYRAYVVTSKTKLDEDDAWWLKHVWRSNVFVQHGADADPADPWFRLACLLSLDLSGAYRHTFLEKLSGCNGVDTVKMLLTCWGMEFGDDFDDCRATESR